MDDIARARSALRALDPNCSREVWVRTGMAAKAAGLSLEDWTQWSSAGENFRNARDCETVWHSIESGGVTAATLYYMAQNSGWSDAGKPRQNVHTLRRSSSEASTVGLRERFRGAQALPARLWEHCEPATEAHPYILAKDGSPSGLRVVPNDSKEHIAGKPIAGWLAVPVRSLAGDLRTLQLIPPPGAGAKLNMPGAAFEDGCYVVGDAAQSSAFFVVEGIGQAWACWKATGRAAVVAFGAGRMTTVCEAVRSAYPSAKLVLVPDRGKEQQAQDIAQRLHAHWVALPDDKPTNYDAADFTAEYGRDMLAQLLAAPTQPPMRYRLLSPAQVAARPPLQWLVRCVLPAQGLACVYGKSGSGKSFIAMDLCAAIASGQRWFNYRVRPAPVAYVALEGEAGFSQRVLAWERHHGRAMPPRLHFIMQPFDLRKPEDRADLPAAVRASGFAGGVLVIDTLNRASSGADENTSADMGELIEAAKELERELGGLVLLIHHSGKDESKGLRGHSSLHGALDAAIEVTRREGQRTWSIAKAKDGRDNRVHSFQLSEVEVGTDDEGEALTSCVVLPDNAVAEVRRSIPPKAGNQGVAFAAVAELVSTAGEPANGDAPLVSAGRQRVKLEHATSFVAERLADVEPRRRIERAKAALTGLHAKGHIAIRGGFVWLT